VGAEHPFGAECRGFVDIVPERYDRATLEDAIAAVPPEVIGTGVIVGTPEQVTARLLQFGDAGLRHVVLGPLSAFITVRDLVYAGWRSEGSLAHCGRDGPRSASHQLGRRKAAVPTGVYDNWGSPVEVTTWKQLGEWVGALGWIGCLSEFGNLRLEQGNPDTRRSASIAACASASTKSLFPVPDAPEIARFS
jgi:hypothetical protein